MPDQQLVDYIKQSLQQGIAKEEIKKSLLGVGWNEKDIDEAFISNESPGNATSKIKNIGVIRKFIYIFIHPKKLFTSIKDERLKQIAKFFIFLLFILIAENFIFRFILGVVIIRFIGPTFAAASSFLGSFWGIVYVPLGIIPSFIITTTILYIILKVLRISISFSNCFKILINPS